MAAEIHRRTGLPGDEGVVDLALAELTEAGLVVDDEPERPAITRRSLIRGLALPAATVAMLPIVETIVVPAANASTSPPSPPPVYPPPPPPPE
jgi:hypothetical protein